MVLQSCRMGYVGAFRIPILEPGVHVLCWIGVTVGNRSIASRKTLYPAHGQSSAGTILGHRPELRFCASRRSSQSFSFELLTVSGCR